MWPKPVLTGHLCLPALGVLELQELSARCICGINLETPSSLCAQGFWTQSCLLNRASHCANEHSWAVGQVGMISCVSKEVDRKGRGILPPISPPPRAQQGEALSAQHQLQSFLPFLQGSPENSRQSVWPRACGDGGHLRRQRQECQGKPDSGGQGWGSPVGLDKEGVTLS